MSNGLVIIGGSYAACEISHAARANGFDGSIRILTDEPDYPYHRPPLSKAFLLDKSNGASLPLKSEKSYIDRNIDIELKRHAVGIDAREGRVLLRDGGAVKFDRLAIATGASVRRLPVPGADLDGVLYLRSLSDAKILKRRLDESAKVVVIGGGFIGLEVASAAVQHGKSVTVLEALPQLLMRVVSPPIASFLERVHRDAGVVIRTNAKVVELQGEGGRVRRVVLEDGTAYEADLVLVGIGSISNSELAKAAGLHCADGIVVDHHGKTSHPAIWAAGDCAFYAGPYTAGGMRLESVQNATDQGKIVGANIAGQSKAYDAIPWFWSDQYKYKLQITGISKGYTAFVERVADDAMSVFYFKDADCIAVDTINRARDHMASRRVLPMGVTRTQLEQAGYDLESLMRSSPGTA